MASMWALGIWAGPAAAASHPQVGLQARIDGRDIAQLGRSRPLPLRPDQQVVITLGVTNNTPRDLPVRSVNLNGKVMSLTFFSFETRIDLLVPPGATETRTFAIELVGLNGQATGLLPGSLELLGVHREVIASRGIATDVRGSLKSVYGIFGLLIAVITALLMLSAILRLAGHRLSSNRWSRGLYFAIAGFGLGLTLTVTLSVFGVMLATPNSGLAIVVGCTIGSFIVGYLTPTPTPGPVADDDDDAEGVEAQSGMKPTASVR